MSTWMLQIAQLVDLKQRNSPFRNTKKKDLLRELDTKWVLAEKKGRFSRQLQATYVVAVCGKPLRRSFNGSAMMVNLRGEGVVLRQSTLLLAFCFGENKRQTKIFCHAG